MASFFDCKSICRYTEFAQCEFTFLFKNTVVHIFDFESAFFVFLLFFSCGCGGTAFGGWGGEGGRS